MEELNVLNLILKFENYSIFITLDRCKNECNAIDACKCVTIQ